MHDKIRKVRERAEFDPVLYAMLRRLAGRTSHPTATSEARIRHYAQADGVAVADYDARAVAKFLSNLGLADLAIVSDGRKDWREIRWRVDAIYLAKCALGLVWQPTDDEIREFMESLGQ